MGTNFYWLDRDADDYRGDHIGKRSAAGAYCWDCGVTLCSEGESGVHHDAHWLDTCPICGKGPESESLSDSAAGVELGFAKAKKSRPAGVKSCSSFRWATGPDVVYDSCRRRENMAIIVNEYGDKFTGGEFLEMLEANCPIRYYSIGQEFS